MANEEICGKMDAKVLILLNGAIWNYGILSETMLVGKLYSCQLTVAVSSIVHSTHKCSKNLPFFKTDRSIVQGRVIATLNALHMIIDLLGQNTCLSRKYKIGQLPSQHDRESWIAPSLLRSYFPSQNDREFWITRSLLRS
jgi:hypothetical protein